MDAEFKRMFLVFDNDTFDNVVEWMNSIQTQNKLDNHSQVILHLMENENNRIN